MTLFLSKTAAPATITFDNDVRRLETMASSPTTATFAAPGEYIVRVQANDRSGDGGGGFQCCWTNVHVKVNVTGGTK